ncbi:MAG: 30S ribosomal protein S6 [Candidatus Eisenbacteria bacterium]|nr:30S ribosomal protein S6 [Candidatus Eisenbacteria bacterium]
MMRTYEGAFIFRPGLDDAGLAEEMGKVENLIVSEGGTIKDWDKWGRRRLSFEIKGETEGYYAFLTFEADPKSIEKLVAAYRLRDNIVRNMNIVQD